MWTSNPQQISQLVRKLSLTMRLTTFIVISSVFDALMTPSPLGFVSVYYHSAARRFSSSFLLFSLILFVYYFSFQNHQTSLFVLFKLDISLPFIFQEMRFVLEKTNVWRFYVTAPRRKLLELKDAPPSVHASHAVCWLNMWRTVSTWPVDVAKNFASSA